MDSEPFIEFSPKIEIQEELSSYLISENNRSLVNGNLAIDDNSSCLGEFIEIKTEPGLSYESNEDDVGNPSLLSQISQEYLDFGGCSAINNELDREPKLNYRHEEAETENQMVHIEPEDKCESFHVIDSSRNKTLPNCVQEEPSEEMHIPAKHRPIRCPECGKSTLKRNLKTHMRIHSGEKPFSCDICGKEFSHKANLTSHLRCHTGEKPFSCPECEKSFHRKDILTQHIKTHTGEKPFKCVVCMKAFSKSSSLTGHEKLHSGVKPFMCNECGKAFVSKDKLRQHMPVHTREKPFKCNVCWKSFSLKSTLSRHMKIHTGFC